MTDPLSSLVERVPALIRRLALSLAVLALSLGVAEGLARAMGYSPWSPTRADVRLEPEGSLFELDPVLGYRHRSGRFQIRQGGLRFGFTHDALGLRATALGVVAEAADSRPELWIFGGSFTHGWGVDDAETYAWQIQERFPDLRVINFGVSGYGTLHSLIQLEEALERRGPPAVAVIAYLSFHDPRNIFARERRKNLVPWNHLGPLRQPQARLGADGELEISMAEAEYRELPLMRQLAIAHLAEIAVCRSERWWLGEADVAVAVLQRIVDLAEREGFGLVIATLTRDAKTDAVTREGVARGWRLADISHDWMDPRFNLLPWDMHPNAAGHRAYADALAAYVASSGLVPDLTSPASPLVERGKALH